MTTQIARVHVPPAATIPPGAVWLAELALQALVVGSAGLRLFATTRRVRAEKRRAERVARLRARDRAALIALAQAHIASQPGFAKDLFAAAARDE